jgi:hypothetical protein
MIVPLNDRTLSTSRLEAKDKTILQEQIPDCSGLFQSFGLETELYDMPMKPVREINKEQCRQPRTFRKVSAVK